jgi:FixJ family two-component response regulator
MTSLNPAIFIIDDDPCVRQAVQRLLRVAGYNVYSFAGAQEFLDCDTIQRPGCLIVDIRMPDIDGLELQQMLCKKVYSMPIVFMTGHGNISMSVEAMKNGAVDFLTKPCDEKDILRAVEVAIERDKDALQKRQDLMETHRKLANLTPREHEIMTYVITGMLNKQIGSALDISEKTVKVHRGRVMEKLGINSVAELVRFCEMADVPPAVDHVE